MIKQRPWIKKQKVNWNSTVKDTKEILIQKWLSKDSEQAITGAKEKKKMM